MGKRVSNIESLYPPFAEKVQEMLRKCNEEELHAYLFETYRSFERQEELYSLGRKKDGDKWVVVDKSKIVTKALPGKSWHAYGLAIDFAFDGNPQKRGIQWTWEDADATKPGKQPLPWGRLGEIGESFGLEWAGRWQRFKEFPHFQMLFGFQRSVLYPILISDGIEAVWKELDKKIKVEKPTIVVPETITTPEENLEEKVEEKPVEEVPKVEEVPENPKEAPKKKPEGMVGIVMNLVLSVLKMFGKKKA